MKNKFNLNNFGIGDVILPFDGLNKQVIIVEINNVGYIVKDTDNDSIFELSFEKAEQSQYISIPKILQLTNKKSFLELFF